MSLVRLFGKDIILYGAGIGPIQRKITKSLLNFIAPSISASTVRDQTSANLISRGANVLVSCDPVWSMEADFSIQKQIQDINWELPILGISLKHDKYLRSTQVSRLAEKILKIFTGLKDWQVLLIPCMPEDLNILYELHNYISSKITTPERIRLLDEFSFYSLESQAGILASCDVVAGMRYHSLLIPISNGNPVFGLIYDTKVKALIENAGQIGVLWKEDFDQAWEYFWQNIDSATEKAKLASEIAKKQHIKNIELLQKLYNS